MKAIIPSAGSETQLKSHTLASPKTLNHPILDYLPDHYLKFHPLRTTVGFTFDYTL